jgi:hypothetical protein
VDAFSLAFGDTINTVTVTWVNESQPEILHGTLSDKDKMITYQLNDAFAGGTVTLEWDQDVAVAEAHVAIVKNLQTVIGEKWILFSYRLKGDHGDFSWEEEQGE